MKAFKFCGLLISGILAGCCLIQPKHGTAIDKIQAALRKGSVADQTIASMPHTSAVNSALLTSGGSVGRMPMVPASQDKRFDISVNNAPAKSFFMGLVAGTPYNMIVSPGIAGNISLKLKSVTVQEALDAVEDLYGYQYRRTPYGFEILPQTLQTQVFNVNYLDVQRTGTSRVDLSSSEITQEVNSNGGGTSSGSNNNSNSANNSNTSSTTTVETKSKNDFWANLTDTLEEMIGDQNGHSVMVNSEGGLVVVRAYPNELHQVSQYLNSLQNSMTRQVIIEAQILEVTLNDDYQAGVNWTALGLTQNPVGGNFAPTSGFITLDTSFQHGDFSTIINLLEQQGNVQVLSSPRVSTTNNQPAVIKVGNDEFFVTSVTSNVVPSGNSATTSAGVGLTPFFSGITLAVTPEISAGGDIVLHVHPSVSQVEDQTKTINLGTQNGVANDLVLPLAKSTVRESDSIVHARNGQVIVIGGLMQNSTEEQLSSTPGLSRIPFFGALFRNTTQKSVKTELVILLRPMVATSSGWAPQLQEASQGFQELNRGFHVGSRPDVFGTRGELND